jgi:hypothetical protein
MKKVSIRASELSFRAPTRKRMSVLRRSFTPLSVGHCRSPLGKSTYLTVTTRPLSAGLCTALKCEVCPQAQARWDRARLSCRKPGEPDDLEEGALVSRNTFISKKRRRASRAR